LQLGYVEDGDFITMRMIIVMPIIAETFSSMRVTHRPMKTAPQQRHNHNGERYAYALVKRNSSLPRSRPKKPRNLPRSSTFPSAARQRIDTGHSGRKSFAVRSRGCVFAQAAPVPVKCSA
jgi:hypothetical protein